MSSVIPRDLEQPLSAQGFSVFRLDYYMTPRMRPSASSCLTLALQTVKEEEPRGQGIVELD